MIRRLSILAATGAALAAVLLVAPVARAEPLAQVWPGASRVESGGQFSVSVTGCIRGDDPEGLALSYTADTDQGLVPRDEAVTGPADATGSFERTLTVPTHIGVGSFLITAICYDDDGTGEPDIGSHPGVVLITPPPSAPAAGTATLGASVLDAGDLTTVHVDGLPPHEGLCSIFLDGTEVLGTFTCPTSGPFDAAAIIPFETPAGPHRLGVYVAAANGIVVASAPVTVTVAAAAATTSTSTSTSTPPSPPVAPGAAQRLPETGTSPGPLASVGLLAIATGVALTRRARTLYD